MLLSQLVKRFKEGIYLRKEYIPVKSLPYTIAHISDLHMSINKYGNPKLPVWVRKSVCDYLFENSIDVLCVTGDLIDKKTDDFKLIFAWLYSLPVNQVIISFGNHDEPLLNQMFEYVYGNKLLRQKLKVGVNTFITHNNIRYFLAADSTSKYNNKKLFTSLLKEKSNEYFNIILSHNPMTFFDYNSLKCLHGKTLMISGHTHGGQIFHADILRSIFSRFISKGKICDTLRINHEHDCFQLQGSYFLDNLTLHINNGLGYHSPGRFFCPPTITIYKPYV